MKYYEFGSTGLEVSRFGLGCMRFGQDSAGRIDEKAAIAMVRYAIDHGVNYCDTAYVYENSEAILGAALANGYRDRTLVATKSNTWGIGGPGDWEKYLDESLARLRTDHVDVYLLHNLYDYNWQRVLDYDGMGFLDRMKQKGKIRFAGFSMHNTLEAFKTAVDAYAWAMAQIQLNILDEHVQAGVEGLAYAAQAGLAVAVMEPLRGGNILAGRPAGVDGLLDAHPERRSLLEWCFRWLYDKPQASVILSGCATIEQAAENIRLFEQAEPGVMSEADQRLIANIRMQFAASGGIGCTGCAYCMPCPSGVAIPDIFRIYNNSLLGENQFVDKLVYSGAMLTKGQGADRCIQCGQCEAVCPQGLSVIEGLQTAHQALLMDAQGFRRK